jgi:hypothetical protein
LHKEILTSLILFGKKEDKWTKIFYSKIGYDYGYFEYFFKTETDANSFSKEVPNFYGQYPTGKWKTDGYDVMYGPMFKLNDSRWNKLKDAYDSTSEVPKLLQQLEKYSSLEKTWQSEIWFKLWSDLCHQGDVYPASFAAVPQLSRIAAENNKNINFNFFLLPAAIEISRAEKGVAISEDLQESYYLAIKMLSIYALRYATEKDIDSTTQKAAQIIRLVSDGNIVQASQLFDSEE